MTSTLQTFEEKKQAAINAFKKRQFKESAILFASALTDMPADVECMVNLGVALKNDAQYAEAEKSFLNAINIQPNNGLARYNLGNTYLAQEKNNLAIEQYKLCIKINANHLDAWLNLGICLSSQNQFEESDNSFQKAIELRQNNAVVECNRALNYHRWGKYEQAVLHFKNATKLAPAYAEAYAGLGTSLAHLGNLDQAVIALKQAVQIRPEYVEARNNLGIYLLDLAKYEEALSCFEQTLKTNPNHSNSRYNRGLVRLLNGNYLEGFRDYEERYNPKRTGLNRPVLPNIFAPRWVGEDLTGKTILIWLEQGAGDSIQSVRFAKELSSKGARVWVASLSSVKQILATCPWVDRVVLREEVKDLSGFDFWVMSFSIPFLLESKKESLSFKEPYLFVDGEKREKWKKRIEGNSNEKFKIGVVWAGNPEHANDKNRSLSSNQLLPLASIDGVDWISLQVSKDKKNQLPIEFNATEVGSEFIDFYDTGAALLNLDLVLTVDTSVAHLAGALGINTYLMLPANPDWRWLTTGVTTPWYSSIRIVRQKTLGFWNEEILKVKNLIETLISKKTAFEFTLADEKSESPLIEASVKPESSAQQIATAEPSVGSTNQALAQEIELARKDAREGQLEKATAAYLKILSVHNKQPDALYGLGRVKFVQERFAEACELMHEAIEQIKQLSLSQREPFEGPWTRDLGVSYQRGGDENKAKEAFYRAQELKPDGKIGDWLLRYWTRTEGPNIQKAVGLHKANKEKLAEKIYREMIARDAHNGEALHLLGCILLNRKEYEESEKLIKKAVRLCPNSHVYQRNLAALLIRANRPEEALRTWRQVLTLDTIDENAIVDVANSLMEHGAYQDAVAAYKKALEKNPNNARSHSSIGRSYTLLKSDDEAKAHLLKAAELDASMLDPQLLLSRIAVDQGNYEDANSHLENCKKISPRHPYVVWTDAFIGLGIYYESYEQSQTLMKDFTRKMNSLHKYLSKASMGEVENAVGYRQPFELAYFQENNRDRLEAYGKAVCLGMSRWQKDKKIPIPKPRKKVGKTRVGIVMGFFFNHSVWNALVKGWMTSTPLDEIEFYVFHTRPIYDKDTQKAKEIAAKFIPSPKSLYEWAKSISDAECDILIYPEIGMENMTIKLAAMRLAPIQVGSWGHAEGSGLPTLDYYLTGDLIEPPNAQANYVEKVVRLPNLGCYIEPWDVTPEDINPEEYGLDPTRPWLVSPGSPYKYRPEDDHMWLDVAKRLPNAQLIFFMHTRRQGVSNRIHGRLERLFQTANMKLEDHAVFIPWMTAPKFFGLMKRSSVFMDTIGFSGFNTAQQGLECDLPVVTIRGNFMRSLLATGLLERIGVTETIVQSKNEYIDMVCRLVQDNEYSEKIRSKIRTNINKIYKDEEAMKGFESFIKNIK